MPFRSPFPRAFSSATLIVAGAAAAVRILSVALDAQLLPTTVGKGGINLSVEVSAPATIMRGEPLYIVLTVRNTGSNPASGARAQFPIPQWFALDVAASDVRCAHVGTQVQCTLDVEPAAEHTVQIVLREEGGRACGDRVHLQPSIVSSSVDSDLRDNNGKMTEISVDCPPIAEIIPPAADACGNGLCDSGEEFLCSLDCPAAVPPSPAADVPMPDAQEIIVHPAPVIAAPDAVTVLGGGADAVTSAPMLPPTPGDDMPSTLPSLPTLPAGNVSVSPAIFPDIASEPAILPMIETEPLGGGRCILTPVLCRPGERKVCAPLNPNEPCCFCEPIPERTEQNFETALPSILPTDDMVVRSLEIPPSSTCAGGMQWNWQRLRCESPTFADTVVCCMVDPSRARYEERATESCASGITGEWTLCAEPPPQPSWEMTTSAPVPQKTESQVPLQEPFTHPQFPRDDTAHGTMQEYGSGLNGSSWDSWTSPSVQPMPSPAVRSPVKDRSATDAEMHDAFVPPGTDEPAGSTLRQQQRQALENLLHDFLDRLLGR